MAAAKDGSAAELALLRKQLATSAAQLETAHKVGWVTVCFFVLNCRLTCRRVCRCSQWLVWQVSCQDVYTWLG